jgi:hypothetical protein
VAALTKQRETWMSIGLDTTPIDKEKARDAVNSAYTCAGMKPPSIFIWLESPMRGAYGAHFLAQVRAQVGDQVRAQVGDQVWAQVRDQVGDQVWAQVGDQVWAQVRAQVWDQVGAQVWDQVWAQVWDQVRDQVGAQVRAQVGAQVGDQVYRAAYGSHDASWIGFYDYFQRNLKLPEPEKISGLVSAAKECGWWWPFENAVIITSKPTAIHRDENFRLHSEDGFSLVYPDGWGIHAWHGVRVPANVIEQPNTITIEQIRKEENAEVRRVMIERMGWDRFCDSAKLRVIHTDTMTANFPSLPVSETVHADMRAITSYRAGTETAELLVSDEFKDFDDRPLKFVRITDPSTGESYTLRVWPENTRAYQAIAQTFGMSESEYKTSIASHS